MRKVFGIVVILVIVSYCSYGQDTLSVSCKDSVNTTNLIRLQPGYTHLVFKSSEGCDSFYVMPGQRYLLIQRDLRACKSFVELYKFYRDEVKKGDQEVSAIVDGYENIIKTKDEAYNNLMNEYTVLNNLLDSSIVQTSSAVDLGKKSLESLDSSLALISENNKQLNQDLKELKKINTKNKIKYGIGGFALGFLVGFLIAK